MRGADALLAALDDGQRRAAQHAHGPVAVIAGAGTGKTRVLVARVAWLIATGPRATRADLRPELHERLGARDRRAPRARTRPGGRRPDHGRHQPPPGQWPAARLCRPFRRALGATRSGTSTRRDAPSPRRSQSMERGQRLRPWSSALARDGAQRLRSPWQAAVSEARGPTRRRMGRPARLRASQARVGRSRLRRPSALRRRGAGIRPRPAGLARPALAACAARRGPGHQRTRSIGSSRCWPPSTAT